MEISSSREHSNNRTSHRLSSSLSPPFLLGRAFLLFLLHLLLFSTSPLVDHGHCSSPEQRPSPRPRVRDRVRCPLGSSNGSGSNGPPNAISTGGASEAHRYVRVSRQVFRDGATPRRRVGGAAGPRADCGTRGTVRAGSRAIFGEGRSPSIPAHTHPSTARTPRAMPSNYDTLDAFVVPSSQ